MVGYEVVNMFAERIFGGASLAVVPEAGRLSTSDMMAISRELNTPETAFVLAPTIEPADYRVRIFTPAGESPFGGHSAVGTAVTLVRNGILPAGEVVQQCGERLMRLHATADTGTLSLRDPLRAGPCDIAVLTAAAGVSAENVSVESTDTAGFGPAFHFLPVCAGAEKGAVADLDVFAAKDIPDVMVFSWDGSTASARLFAPGYSMPDDPACAPAALGLGVWLVRAGMLSTSDGTHAFMIRQGGDRIGVLSGRVEVVAGEAVAASVTGSVLPVIRGEISIG